MPRTEDYDNLFAIGLLDHRNSASQQCHAVTFLERSFLLLSEVVLSPQADDVVQSRRVVALAVLPKSHAFTVEGNPPNLTLATLIASR